MNTQLQDFARSEIIEGLNQLPENSQLLFKRMYANGDLSKSVEQVVNEMPENKLDWALSQVTRTLQNK